MKKTDIDISEIIEKTKDISNKVTAAVKKALAVLWKRVKKIKIADIVVIAGVLTLSSIIIVPSLLLCAENYDKERCLKHMYRMKGALLAELTEEAEYGGTYWQNIIKSGDYELLLTALNGRVDDNTKYTASDFGINVNGEKLEFICKKHESVSRIEFLLSSVQNLNMDFNHISAPEDGITYITVKGPSDYYQNSILDTNHPEKKIFSGEDLDYVLNNLTVQAVYAGGRTEKLKRDTYTITSGELDMTKAGHANLIISTNSDGFWHQRISASFVINVIGDDSDEPLIVDAGKEGRYELAGWDWKDFVAEAAAEDGGKTFGASIIRVNGKYYYYPDGLTIINGSPNTTPFEYALDTNGSGSPAYNIPFDTNSVITDSADSGKVHNGSLRAENDRIYIWQDEPSKELPRGWIRVYCEISKY